MLIGKAEFIDEFFVMIKRELDRLLPLREQEDIMLKKAKRIVSSKIDHIRMNVNKGD